MTDYHNRIMNIKNQPGLISYRQVQKFIRHSAAEIAIEADIEIERLRALVSDALEDKTEFDTEWDKSARAALKR